MKVLSVINNDKDAVTKEYVDSKAGVTAVDPTSGPVETDFFIPTKTSELTNDSGFITEAALTTKQDTLVSGTNIKTINNESLLGSGNITISGGGSATDVQIDGVSITSGGVADIASMAENYDKTSNPFATSYDLEDKSNYTIDYINGNIIADNYLTSGKTYNCGDIVSYDLKLYMCINDNVRGSWDSSDWQQITIKNLFGDTHKMYTITGDLPISLSYVLDYIRDSYIPNIIAEHYNYNNTYNVGDYVMYEDGLWVCTTKISTPEQWNSSHWSMISITSIIGNIESLLGGI